MREWLLDYLRCPRTRTPLRIEQAVWKGDDIDSGRLVNESGSRDYPIIRGIPRLVPGVRSEADLGRDYANSFGYQWNTFDWPREADEHEFFSISDQTPQSLASSIVLDAGCGGGRLSRVMAVHCRRLIGFDLSVAVERARQHTSDLDNCEFVQGDVVDPPFVHDQFDFVWSHGVLHHTPDTHAAFNALVPLVKPGGKLHVVLFLKTWMAMRASDGVFRMILRQLPHSAAARVCRAMGALRHLPAASFWKRFFWFSLQPSPQLRTCCNFDWYMPRYHHEHTVAEVKKWFRKNGLDRLRYVNGWPYAPRSEKFAEPGPTRRGRLGQLLGVVGQKPGVLRGAKRGDSLTRSVDRLETSPADACSLISTRR